MIGSFFAIVLATTDGDTFRARLEVWPGVEVVTAVRLRGIDTPEIHGKCSAEKAAALAAKARLAALLAGGRVEVSQVTLDKFAGRIDGLVSVDGVRVDGVLIAEGLARPYTGGARLPWCP